MLERKHFASLIYAAAAAVIWLRGSGRRDPGPPFWVPFICGFSPHLPPGWCFKRKGGRPNVAAYHTAVLFQLGKIILAMTDMGSTDGEDNLEKSITLTLMESVALNQGIRIYRGCFLCHIVHTVKVFCSTQVLPLISK